LVRGRLPRARTIQPAQLSQRFDEAGQFLATRYPVGTFPASDRSKIINEAVEFYFGGLRTGLQSVKTEGFLEYLVEAHESVIHEQARIRLTMPTAAECFTGEYSNADRTMRHLDALTRTAMSARFLIEYCAAVPPSGAQRLSLETYDELISLCCEIVERGLHSDAIHFGLSNSDVSLLPSGRLGIDRDDRYLRTMDFFRMLRASHAAREAADYFDRHWRDPIQAREAPRYTEDLSLAFQAEFGVLLPEMGAFLSVIQDLGDTLPGEAKVMKLPELERRLQDELTWHEGRVSATIEEFSLRPRPSFYPETNKAAVYPWRYGRDLSYLRRPLLIRAVADSDPEVVWGNRHLTQVGPYVLRLCLSGRLRARSTQMRKFVGEIRNQEPEAFNDQVAEHIEISSPGISVRRRVKKIGNTRLRRDDGSDLGDVDVLVIDPVDRRIAVVETKDFDLARTPAELQHEIERLSLGPNASIRKHLERVAWITEHASEVARWVEVPASAQPWEVSGLLITSREILSRHLSELPIRTLTLQELVESGEIFAGSSDSGQGRRRRGSASRTRRRKGRA